jgi:hypothetical protein
MMTKLSLVKTATADQLVIATDQLESLLQLDGPTNPMARDSCQRFQEIINVWMYQEVEVACDWKTGMVS